ncbi:hypothetical protein [uncultured Jatrophihabitans sp.]|uniref:hypothetical protein n=1 Tax=uncultured Jatrophihabitans sp. TaxID=1610747 RepID=UPI0035CA2D9F
MLRPAVRLARLFVVVAFGALAAAGCSSAVSGTGAVAGSASTTADFPSTTPAPTQPARSSSSDPSMPASTPAPTVTPTAITVTGTSSQQTYQAQVYAADDISDCAAHAYGATMVAFLKAHQCGPTHRTLALVDLAGQQVVVSSIATSFAGTSQDPYGVSIRFQKLELADGTGSIDDLLREGHSIPGIATAVPAHEAFQVVGQDNGVDVFDAWYASGPTRDQDRTLLNLEQDLFLTSLTSGR